MKGNGIHLYKFQDVLKPRGTMKKESLGALILERLCDYYESWTSEEYGDLPSEDELLKRLNKNLKDEVENAWLHFLIEVEEKAKKR